MDHQVGYQLELKKDYEFKVNYDEIFYDKEWKQGQIYDQ